MIIEDPDAFRNWLTAKLGPLCDADPQALAKYVYALVKKDKPIEELRATMLDQLEVFLERDTQEFVDVLFRTLETKAFDLKQPEVAASEIVGPPQESKTTINTITTTTTVDDPTTSAIIPESLPAGETTKDVFIPLPLLDDSDKRSGKDSNPALLASAQNSNSLASVLLPSAASRKEPERHTRKGDSDKEDKSSRRGRRRDSSVSPERRRSRSRSLDRRRSRSRERDRGRAWRNKSPPSRRYERRRTYSKSPPPRRYSKSRSPQGKRTRYRNRSPPRSRSRSPLGSRERKDASTGLSPKEVTTSHGDTDMRNLQSVVNIPPDVQFPRRCRDFDEQGFCMRGDLCPFDHGTDPVILEDLPVPVFNGGPQPPPPPLVPQAPPPSLIRHPVHPPIRPLPPINLAEYNPDAPSMEPRMWGRPPRFRGGPVMRGVMRGMGRGGFPHQRELINVVGGVLHFRHPRPMNPNEFSNGRVPGPEGPPPGFDYGRLGNNRALPFHPKNGNTSLQLKRIPPGANNITHLNEHFSRFGKIVNIQVCFEGDPESALVTFSNHTEANIAIKSTEAVMNNRFIRVFWYNQNNNNSNNLNNNSNANNENKQENAPPVTRSSVLERLGAHPSKVLNNIQPSAVQLEEKVTAVNNNLSKTLYIPSAKKEAAVLNTQIQKPQNNDELKKKLEEVTLAKKKQLDAIKAGFKLNADLRKRKTELLEKQINHQKLLIQRMEDPATTPQQKSALMDTIKTLQDSIEQIRKDLKSSVKAAAPGKVTKNSAAAEQRALLMRTRDEAKRQLLDAELDLMNNMHEGKNTEELIKRVADLKKTIYNLETRTSSRGRGGAAVRMSRGRGRGSKFVAKNISYDHNVVDHRPTKVLISGYEQDDKDELIQHFEKFGKIVNYESDDATPSLVINYSSRKEAELAINTGKNFEDRVLSVTWATPNMNIRSGVITKPETSSRSVSIVEDEEEVGEEEAMDDMDDDFEYVALMSPTSSNPIEDTEEEEDRSWRR